MKCMMKKMPFMCAALCALFYLMFMRTIFFSLFSQAFT